MHEVESAAAEITRRRQGELLSGVFALLAESPEGLDAKDVLTGLRRSVPPTPFEASEYPNRPGVVRYDKIVRFASIVFVKAGWLTKTKGRWGITEEGAAAWAQHRGDPEEFMRAAVGHYQQWKKDQPSVLSPVGELESEAADVAIGYEEAEEAAFAEIKAHIERVSPFDFQDLVAAVLKGMGYHVAWIAPPGPDKGVDIVAGTDPLGIQDPRIRFR
jgi:restriction system protein